ncbi:two-component sensor histidine kinase, partial [Bacillus subtilis]|uniref:ATP-binding protein n=1 Tax=Bacillus subtilis TaxID=1423 RepID=UPI000E9E5FA3
SRKYGGSGLGLAITKSIIDSHNGSIEVKSEIGKGTVFLIRLHASDYSLDE